MTLFTTGLLCWGERPWRRAPDTPAPDGDIYQNAAAERAALMQQALDAGITLFHAAHEREAQTLGDSMARLGAREHITLSTTDGDALARCPDTESGAYDAVQRAIARKQALLGTPRLGIFHLYDVRRDVHTPARLAGASRALAEARERGLVAHFGATCYGDYDYLAQVIETNSYAPDCIAARFSFADTGASARLLPACAARDIPALATQTFAWRGGVSFVRFPNTWRLRNMTQNFTGQSVARAHLRWVLGQDGIAGVLVSMQDAAQLKENAQAVIAQMPRADMASVFASFVEAIDGTAEGWQGLLEDPEWEVRTAAAAYLDALSVD